MSFGGTDRNPGIIESSLPVGRLRSRSHPIAWLLRSVFPCDRTPPWKTLVATPPYLQRGRRAIHHRRGPLVAGPVALWVSVQFLRAAAAATLLVEWQPSTTATTSDNPVSPSTREQPLARIARHAGATRVVAGKTKPKKRVLPASEDGVRDESPPAAPDPTGKVL